MSQALVKERSPASGGVLTSPLGSVVAVVPLCVWVTWHLWENLSAWAGDEAWETRVSRPESSGANILVSVVVFAPLLLHTAWGLRRLAMTRPNGYRFFGNLKYLLQRASALGMLAFLVAHVYLARIKPTLEHPGYETFDNIARQMRHHPPTLVVYVLGVLGTAYHLANGIYTAAFIHGLAASPRASRWMLGLSMGLFVVLLAMGWGAVAGLFQAGGPLMPPTN